MEHYRLSFTFLTLTAFLLCVSCSRVQVSIDDIGDAGDKGHTTPRNLDRYTADGFQNKTIVPLGDTGIGFSGVDILVVVDNSGTTMYEAQTDFATDLYAAITKLTEPRDNETDKINKIAVKNIRLAVTTTDLGLQYGETGLTDTDTDIAGCEGLGDDGQFGENLAASSGIVLKSDRIACDTSGIQCPAGWTCGGDGLCDAPADNTPVDCTFQTGNSWIEMSSIDPDPLFAEKAACLANRGTGGCSLEQQLESVLRALYQNPGFLVKSHMLAVVILSDDEDCSVEDPALFTTTEWMSGFCGNPYLFDPSRYLNELVRLKAGNLSAVLFLAAVGPVVGGACSDPGLRFVETASLFGEQGVVQSICTTSLSPMVDKVDNAIAKGQCLLSEALETEDASTSSCQNCVQSECEMYIEILRTGEAATDVNCPQELVFGAEHDYNNKAAYKQEFDAAGELISTRVFCPVKKLPAPLLDCEWALDQGSAGWAYCENQTEHIGMENTEYMCSDGINNDSDDLTDCDDSDCASCTMCGNPAGACELGCKYNILMTSVAAEAAEGNNMFLECPYR